MNCWLLLRLLARADTRVKDMTDLNLVQDYGNDCDLDHLQDIDTSNGHDGVEC